VEKRAKSLSKSKVRDRGQRARSDNDVKRLHCTEYKSGALSGSARKRASRRKKKKKKEDGRRDMRGAKFGKGVSNIEARGFRA